jgi:long-chain acyl-CoA synthetase
MWLEGTIGKPLAGREVKLGPDGEVLVRGAAISHATWSGTGLCMRAPMSGWPRATWRRLSPPASCAFLGRKSEVIVTAAGLNLHPEDLEAAIEQEPGVAAVRRGSDGDGGWAGAGSCAGHARAKRAGGGGN